MVASDHTCLPFCVTRIILCTSSLCWAQKACTGTIYSACMRHISFGNTTSTSVRRRGYLRVYAFLLKKVLGSGAQPVSTSLVEKRYSTPMVARLPLKIKSQTKRISSRGPGYQIYDTIITSSIIPGSHFQDLVAKNRNTRIYQHATAFGSAYRSRKGPCDNFFTGPVTIFFHREVSGVTEHQSPVTNEEAQYEYKYNTCIVPYWHLVGGGMGGFSLALLKSYSTAE